MRVWSAWYASLISRAHVSIERNDRKEVGHSREDTESDSSRCTRTHRHWHDEQWCCSHKHGRAYNNVFVFVRRWHWHTYYLYIDTLVVSNRISFFSVWAGAAGATGKGHVDFGYSGPHGEFSAVYACSLSRSYTVSIGGSKSGLAWPAYLCGSWLL